MPFTDQQRERALRAIEDRLGETPICPLCRAISWELTDGIVVVEVHQPGNVTLASDDWRPRLQLSCTNCGNVLTFNVAALALQDLVGGGTTDG